MIITYAVCEGKYNNFLFVPDGMPWKLVADIERFSEGTEDNPDAVEIDYALCLVTGAGMKENVLLSEEFWGCVPEELDEEEWVLDLFNFIVAASASDFANALSKKENVYDLGATITRCIERWELDMKKVLEGGVENEE